MKQNKDFYMHITTSSIVGTQKKTTPKKPPSTWSNKLLILRFAVEDHGLL